VTKYFFVKNFYLTIWSREIQRTKDQFVVVLVVVFPWHTNHFSTIEISFNKCYIGEVDQDPELESLSDWVRTIRSLVQGRIQNSKIVLIVDLSLYLKTKKLLSVLYQRECLKRS
jgi:hypothetical protein